MSEVWIMDDLSLEVLDESQRVLLEVESRLAYLMGSPDDRKVLDDVFHSFRTLKADAELLETAGLADFFDVGERLFDKLRNGDLQLTPTIMKLLVPALGSVRLFIGSVQSGERVPRIDLSLTQELALIIDGKDQIDVGTKRPLHGHVSAVLQVCREAGADGRLVCRSAITKIPSRAEDELVDSRSAMAGLSKCRYSRFPEPANDSHPTLSAEMHSSAEMTNERTRSGSAYLDRIEQFTREILLAVDHIKNLHGGILSGPAHVDTPGRPECDVEELGRLVSNLRGAVIRTRETAREARTDIRLGISAHGRMLNVSVGESLKEPRCADESGEDAN